MNPHDAGARRREDSRDVLSAAEFFALLRQTVGFKEHPTSVDPLRQAVDQINANPAFAQAQLLRRILVALVTGGNFRRAETTALDAPTHGLVLALLALRGSGARSRHDWNDAIDAAALPSA